MYFLFYLHIVGFVHENNRDDRDQNVRVDFQAIQDYEKTMFLPNGTWQKQFIKCSQTRMGKKWGCQMLNAYDHASITHYPEKISDDFSKSIITSKKICGNKTCDIGQRERLSKLDIKDIEALYECGKRFKSFAKLQITMDFRVLAYLCFND